MQLIQIFLFIQKMISKIKVKYYMINKNRYDVGLVLVVLNAALLYDRMYI